jgi:hypothetical protein
MNKTVKTIAWICLVLGLLGTALDVGAFVVARNIFADRQANFEEFRGQFESGDLPRFKSRSDEDVDGDAEEHMDWDDFSRFGMMAGGSFSQRGGFNSGMIGSRTTDYRRTVFPFAMAAVGPILLVVGTVMLIVNREPEVKVKEEKKDKTKKSK